MSLINAVVSEKDQVQDIEVRNPYTRKETTFEKFAVLDIKAQATNGTYYNIEVQVTDDLQYDKRSLYYWAKLYSEQLISGASYGDLQKTIGIHVLNFSLLDEDNYHNTFHIVNRDSGKKFSDMLELHYIELPKVPTDFTYIQNALDRWSSFLARAERYTATTLPEALSSDPMICKAMAIFESTRLDESDRQTYEARLKWLRDEISALETRYMRGMTAGEQRGLVIGEQRGIAIGEERGIAIGEERGIAIGEERGIAIGEELGIARQKREMAQKMASEGFDRETIQKITGLYSW